MSVRKLMGVGSYTTVDRGMTSYCMSDGRKRCTKKNYKTVETNLIAKLGQPEYTDQYGARYWFVEKYGCIILPRYDKLPYQYVEVDKSCTREYFDREVCKYRKYTQEDGK